MKRFFACFAVFAALVFVVSCGGGSSDSKTGSLYEKCYSNETCNKGLICDIENNVCVKDWCKSNNDCTDPEYPVCNTKTGNCESSDGRKPGDESDSDSDTQDSGDSSDDSSDLDSDSGSDSDADSAPADTGSDSGDSTDDVDSSDSHDDTGDSTDDGDSGADTGDDGDTGSSTLPECSTSSGTPCYDSTSHLTWSKISSNYMSYTAATTFCQGSEMKGYGGFTDWRLPNIDELKTLITVPSGTPRTQNCAVSEATGHLASSDWTCSTCTEACTQSTSGTGCSSCNGSSDGRYSKLGDGEVWLWSSSTVSDFTDYAWFVDFGYGDVNGGNEALDYYVRCVR